ncbi:DUF418 domain-containing protein [Marinitenerispora sediminis]|uniref:DUF418 domain-containing protein n=1 Tax=Marinitenerispora sediminis TaxID=1931232 RepID=UPI0018F195C3|nr:DUF418 domain-containing protein [Marinitenerispora sediminis]
MSPPRSVPRGPARPDERALAPDLARGAMLLLIVLANTPWYLGSYDLPATAHPVDGAALDRVVRFVMIVAVDARSYPMFALLFGYGMVRLYDRQRAAGGGERAAAALVRRRNLWLLAFGFAHAALLFAGDILGAYGLAGLVLGGLLLRQTEPAVRLWAGLLGTLVAALFAFSAAAAVMALADPASAAGDAGPTAVQALLQVTFTDPDAATAMARRAVLWPLAAVAQALSLIIPAAVAVGMWAARHRVLERPARYRRLLVRVAVAGVGVGWLTGLPQALAHVGLLEVADPAYAALAGLATLGGPAGGVGYVAVFALFAARYNARAPRRMGRAAVTVLTAVGSRSLSCYLAQSLLCAPLLAAWGLGLGAHLGSAGMAGVAAAVWLLTAAAALALHQARRRGPAEALLRRLVYGRAV